MNRFFAPLALALLTLLALTGCDGIGLPDSTDDVDRERAQGDATDEPAETETEDELESELDSECLFGTDISEMAAAEHLVVEDFAHVIGPDELDGLEKEQLLSGFSAYGWGELNNVEELLARFVDDQRILVRTVVDVQGQTAYTHLAFWTDGHENGYLFLQDSLRLAAAVDGGSIYDCAISR